MRYLRHLIAAPLLLACGIASAEPLQACYLATNTQIFCHDAGIAADAYYRLKEANDPDIGDPYNQRVIASLPGCYVTHQAAGSPSHRAYMEGSGLVPEPNGYRQKVYRLAIGYQIWWIAADAIKGECPRNIMPGVVPPHWRFVDTDQIFCTDPRVEPFVKHAVLHPGSVTDEDFYRTTGDPAYCYAAPDRSDSPWVDRRK